MTEKELSKKARLRIDILKMIHKSNSGHTGGSLFGNRHYYDTLLWEGQDGESF